MVATIALDQAFQAALSPVGLDREFPSKVEVGRVAEGLALDLANISDVPVLAELEAMMSVADGATLASDRFQQIEQKARALGLSVRASVQGDKLKLFALDCFVNNVSTKIAALSQAHDSRVLDAKGRLTDYGPLHREIRVLLHFAVGMEGRQKLIKSESDYLAANESIKKAAAKLRKAEAKPPSTRGALPPPRAERW